MLNKIIDVSLKNPLVVVLLLAASLGLGIRAMLHTPVDAFPDTTPCAGSDQYCRTSA